MKDHTLGYYLDLKSTLTPEAASLRDVAQAEWWKALEPFFDDLIWQFFSERELFCTDKFDPRDQEETYKNILRSFSINLKTKARQYERMYNVTIRDYNPLYNVDAFEYEDRTLDQTGTQQHTKTGTDSSTRSGSETDTKAGKEANIRTGSEENKPTGSDTETTSNTTYDSAAFLDREKKITEPGVTTTTTYKDVKDETSYTDRVDTHVYDQVKDENSYNTSNLDNRNLKDKEAIVKRRYGNIGVTKSSELVRDEMNTWSAAYMDVFKRIVKDCVNCVSYALY